MSRKKYWNSHLKSMEGYTYGIQPEMTADTVKLNTNECPYGPSPQALEAIRKAANDTLRRYPKATWDDLREAISNEYKVAVDRIFCSNGSDEFLSLLFRTFAEAGDTVTLTDPTYSLYSVLARSQGIRIETVTTGPDYRIPFGQLSRSESRLLIITNPNAPTGLLESPAVLESCIRDFPGVVVVDEAYIDFADNPSEATVLPLIERYDNLLVARTFSKSFSLCGIRAGYAFGNPDLIAGLLTAKDSYNLDAVAQAAATAAMRDADWMRESARKVRATREEAASTFRDLGFSVVPSQANFLLVSHPDREALQLYEKLLERSIYVRHFPLPGLENSLRISIGTDDEMARLFTAIKQILQGEK